MDNPAYDGLKPLQSNEPSDFCLDTNETETSGFDPASLGSLRNSRTILSSASVFKADTPLRVRVTNLEKRANRILYSYTFKLHLEYAGYYWTIHRDYEDIMRLHRNLQLQTSALQNPRTFNCHIPNLPEPFDHSAFIIPGDSSQVQLAIEDYLTALLSMPLLRNHRALQELLEVSHFSFVGEPGEKAKELVGKILSGKMLTFASCVPVGGWLSHLFCRWKRRRIIIQQTYILFTDVDETVVKDVILFDGHFRIVMNGNGSRRKSIRIRNSSRELVIQFGDQQDLEDWSVSLDRLLASPRALPFVQANPHGSSYPVRHNISCKWYIDGAPYMSAVADALELAQEEIFLMYWWLTPEIFLKRPIGEGGKWRLDNILERKATAGVKVYIIVYKDIAMGHNSQHTKATLESRHPNIKVLLGPSHSRLHRGAWFWSHHEKTVIIDQRIAFTSGLDLCFGKWDDHFYRLTDIGSLDFHNRTASENIPAEQSGRLWPGADYTSDVRKGFTEKDIANPFRERIDRSKIPRIPWHETGCLVLGQSARDIARHFIETWNNAKLKRKRKNIKYQFILPKTNDTESLPLDHFLETEKCTVQVLRSVGPWSAGLRSGLVEDSIHKTYCSLIEEAQRFIYIEGPFFDTLTGSPDEPIMNRVGDALFRRIERAYRCGDKFRVYMVLPLRPGVDGEFGKKGNATLQVQAHWLYQSLCRGGSSLFEHIRAIGANPEYYISVCGMRTFGELDGKLVSEMVYVHSKVIIIDDVAAMLGSANINDRSLLGDRDSELNVLVRDEEFPPGKLIKVGKFASSLRKRLMRIHLGLFGATDFDETISDLDDIVCDDFFNEWNRIAANNAAIYEEVFGTVPCDSITDFNELTDWQQRSFLKDTAPEAARLLLKSVKGYLCKFSLRFLEKEDLTPPITASEWLLPSKVWT